MPVCSCWHKLRLRAPYPDPIFRRHDEIRAKGPAVRSAGCSLGSGLMGTEGHGEAREAAYGVVRLPSPMTLELDAAHLTRERPEQRLALHTDHRFADAHVEPELEGQVPARFARDVEPVWVLPTARVAVGRPQRRYHPFVLGDPDASELGGPGCSAEELLHRGSRRIFSSNTSWLATDPSAASPTVHDERSYSVGPCSAPISLRAMAYSL